MDTIEGQVDLTALIARGCLGARVGQIKLRANKLAEFLHDTAHGDIPKELRAITRRLARILSDPEVSGPKYPQGLEVLAEIIRLVHEHEILWTLTMSEDLTTWATWVGTAKDLLETQERTERTLQ
ncbi:MAG: hypothetical protein WAV09_04510 [Minisyncoccia bacterium]